MSDEGIPKKAPIESGDAEILREEVEKVIDDALADSLKLLESKIGTVVISDQDKYRIALDSFLSAKEDLKLKAISQKFTPEMIQTESMSLVHRATVFDGKMQDLVVEHNRGWN